jgi:hypothetical protein
LERHFRIISLRQYPAANGHDGVGGDHKTVLMPVGNDLGLGQRHTLGIIGRQFARMWRFVDLRRVDRAWLKPYLAQQIKPAWRGGCQDQR